MQEDFFITANYSLMPTPELLASLPKRNWNSIKLHAEKLSLKRSHTFCRESDLRPLLEETHEAYYWTGFLLADGCISHSTWRLTLGLATKDAQHLAKFAKFINCTNIDTIKHGPDKKYSASVLKAQNKEVLPLFVKKFDFKPAKTYNPPILKIASSELFLSLLVGFIDGDGCIKKLKNRNNDVNIAIKNHASWKPVLEYFEIESYRALGLARFNEKPLTRINNAGCAVLIFSDSQVVHALKKHVDRFNLPVLERKWGEIAGAAKTRYRDAAKLKGIIKTMHSTGQRQTSIAKSLELTDGYVSMVLKGER